MRFQPGSGEYLSRSDTAGPPQRQRQGSALGGFLTDAVAGVA